MGETIGRNLRHRALAAGTGGYVPYMEDERQEETPEEKAAKGTGGGEDRNPQDETENDLLDHDEHSDAPGPFGTG
jgi:hypothetical protein